MNLAISNIAWLPEQRFEVYSLMQDMGYTGLEIAPALFQRVAEFPYSQQNHLADEAKAELADYGLQLVSMQALHFGESGMALFASEAERQKLLDYTKQAIDFAGRLGIRNLVFGSPKLRNIPEGMAEQEVQDIAQPFFLALAQHAQALGCIVGLEPNAAEYGTNFINTTEQAFSLIQQVNHPALRLNLDMGNLIVNETEMAAIIEAAPVISHVHFSLPMLRILSREVAPTLLQYAQALLPIVPQETYFSIEMGKSDIASIEQALSLFSGEFHNP